MTTEAHVDVEAAYQALHEGAMLSDRSDRARILFTGEKAAESLTGLVTSDVLALQPGKGQYAAALTAKGKILADLRIFARSDGLLVDASPTAAPNWVGIVRKYVNPRLAKYKDISGETGDIGVFGGRASDLVRSSFPDAVIVPGMEHYSHITASVGGSPVMIIVTPEFGVDGYDIVGPQDVLTDIRSQLVAAGAAMENPEALRIARIEAGRPVWGVDMDDTLLAQEMDMERFDAISFTKGCYTGQETVARVHFRGHVNRILRGLRLDSPTLPPSGSTLVTAEGKEVGVVKSSAVSPKFGAIALAVVRLEVEIGSEVSISWAEGRVNGRVDSLPFGP
jgi:tRNA-modifying protein YgfZ